MTAQRVALAMGLTGVLCIALAIYAQYGTIPGLAAGGIGLIFSAPFVAMAWGESPRPRF